MARRNLSDAERDEAVTLVPIDEADADMPGDAAKQWAEFDNLRDQGEAATAGMVVWCYQVPTDPSGQPASGAESALLFSAPIDAYTLAQIFDRVKKEYMPRGSGRALVRISVRREKQRGVVWQKLFPIIKGVRDDEPEAGRGDDGGALGKLANMIGDALNRQNAMIAELMRQQRQPVAQVDPIAQSRSIIEMVTALSAVLAKPVPAAPAGSPTGLGELLTVFRDFRKLAREMGDDAPRGEDGEGNSIPQILQAGKPYVEMLTALIQRAPNAPVPGVRRLPPAQPPVAPNPNAAGSASVMPPVAATPTINTTMGSAAVTPQGTDPMLLQLKKHLGEICDLIETGTAEPEGMARLILDLVPDEMDEKFYGIVSDQYWMVKLKAVEPRVAQHAEFFGRVREFIMQEFTDETEGSEPTG